jgi:uncharacterized protein YerC
MRSSSQKTNINLYRQLRQLFFQLFADLKDSQEIETFLTVFLSEQELLALVKRLGIAYYLNKKHHYAEIKRNLRVSSATVSEIARQVSQPGYQLALKKIRADEWANRWADKLSSVTRLLSPKNKS